ncbi:hypothetical protein HWV62_6747 [Athelia sp. TMB]|nr:hypothetical protein HWV62_6747 [Athelia sp. TMB]
MSSLVLDRPTEPFGWYTVNPYPRPFPPLLTPPPLPSLLPDLPSPPRAPTAVSQTYLLSQHIIPAAYPRVAPVTTTPLEPAPAPDAGREERMKVNGRRADAIVSAQRAHGEALTPLGAGDTRVHWTCVNRYVNRGPGAGRGMGVTLLLAHGTGLPKETWEPTLQHLFADPGAQIDEVWALDAVQHGDSALLNKNVLSETFDWIDNARDILNFVVHYLPAIARSDPLPLHLPRVPAAEAARRETDGIPTRTLVSIGHSFGGACSFAAVVNYPALFSALVLVDPIILRATPGYDRWPHRRAAALQTLQRRAHWPSASAARAALAASRFYRTWHPAVLDAYLEHGLYPANGGGVALKTTPAQEAAVFAEGYLPLEAYEQLDRLDARVALLWVLPGPGEDGLDGLEGLRARVWRRTENTAHVRLAGAGHSIPQEHPGELARELKSFLQQKYGKTDKPRL